MGKIKKICLWIFTTFAWVFAQIGITQAAGWQNSPSENGNDSIYLAIYLAQNRNRSDNTGSQIEKIFDVEFEEMYHYSHRSHVSHRSHYSHYSSYY